MKRLLLSLILFLSVHIQADPLFESEETLSIKLSADFSTLRREKNKSKEYQTLLGFDDQQVPVTLKVRGNNRLKKCDSPPLRLILDKKEVKTTLFDNQSELKLVVPCKKGKKYLEYVRLEYLIYQIYRLFSEDSFRVRWLAVTYDNDGEITTGPGFFIERKKRLAKRRNMESVKQPRIGIDQLQPVAAARVSAFMYLVGNLDFSILQASAGDGDCCHNVKLMKPENTESGFVPVPYDFDSAGLVNPPYATPPSVVDVSSVRVRRYRGFCEHKTQVAEFLSEVLTRKKEITSLIEQDAYLSDRSKSRATSYLNRFFDLAENPKRRDKQIISACR